MKKNEKLILLVSGKRWSGKDCFCNQTIAYFHSKNLFKCMKLSHSNIVKERYCQQTGANLPKLLSDRLYKEIHRNKMIAFAQKLQTANPTILSEMVLAKISQDKFDDIKLILISDFRREFEQTFFEHAFGASNIVTLRIKVSNENREKRGWAYDSIKDTRYTECELDDKHDWNLIFHNDGTKDDMGKWIQSYFANYLINVFFSKENKRMQINHDKSRPSESSIRR